MQDVSERNIEAFHQDMDALSILRPDRMPRATQCLDGIRAMIRELESNGAAYSMDGDVYFAVMKHHSYGKLSGRDLTEQQQNAGGRVADAEEARKQHSFDFALWKGAKTGETSFPSAWGAGRPGWHIECSAMVREELGETIDIHLGGADLIFPHHENEIAQSEAATGKELARYWLHNGMVNVGGQKMSKSLGNFTTIRALLESGVSPMTLRLFILQAHYRKPLDFTSDAINAAATGWKGLNAAIGLGNIYAEILGWPKYKPLLKRVVEPSKASNDQQYSQIRERFIDVMDDDLNTAGAIAVLFELARPLRSLSNRLERGDKKAIPEAEQHKLLPRWKLLVELAGVLGLQAEACTQTEQRESNSTDENSIKAAITARQAAKATRDFAKADQIRNELLTQGIELIDKPGGITDWIKI